MVTLPKPPFKAKPDDKIFCPNVGHVVSVDAYCNGWAFRDELCHSAETCEPYLGFVERRSILSSKKAPKKETNRHIKEVKANV